MVVLNTGPAVTFLKVNWTPITNFSGSEEYYLSGYSTHSSLYAMQSIELQLTAHTGIFC